MNHMKYRTVVFIDPGTKMGWTRVERTIGIPENPVDPKFTSGAIELPSEPGPRVKEFWTNLRVVVGPYPSQYRPIDPDGKIQRRIESTEIFLAWEEAAFSRHHAASRMYGMWEGLLLLFCEQHKIPYIAVNQSTIKTHAKREGFYNPRPPRPHRAKKEKAAGFKVRMDSWKALIATTKFDDKPRPRPEWQLTAPEKLQEHEIDSRWGLEYILHRLEEK